MRVIAGKLRSRRLRSLRGADIRPTSDRLRETLFNVLTAGNPDALKASVWLDLYAGTGAVGIEALSRGAGWCSLLNLLPLQPVSLPKIFILWDWKQAFGF